MNCRFVEFRNKENLSTADFAKKIGVAEETLIRWENGTENPSDEELERISIILNCFPSYLSGETNVNFPRKRPATTSTPQSPQIQTVSTRKLCCPHCGKTDLAFVTEYHKSYGARIAKFIFGFLAIIFGLEYFAALISSSSAIDDRLAGIIFFAVAFLTAQGVQEHIESRTHVQAICKDCGHLWLLN
jgi:DNA-binding XRE family transcriptional regulator